MRHIYAIYISDGIKKKLLAFLKRLKSQGEKKCHSEKKFIKTKDKNRKVRTQNKGYLK